MHYLATVMLFGVIWLFFYLRYPGLRSCSLLSGLLFLPAGFTQALFVPAYWNPDVIVKVFGLFDLESLLFAFFTGGIASVLYPACFRCRIGPVPVSAGKRFRHSLWLFPVIAAAVLVGAGLYTKVALIRIAFAVFILGIFHVIFLRPDMIHVCFWGALLFLVTYSGVALLTALVSPGFVRSAWKTAPLFGWRLLQVPFDEFVYAFLFGGLWSAVYCGVANRRFVRSASGGQIR